MSLFIEINGNYYRKSEIHIITKVRTCQPGFSFWLQGMNLSDLQRYGIDPLVVCDTREEAEAKRAEIKAELEA